MPATVSIIIPIYQVQPYLHHCIDSVLRQDYHDLDVILIDDGSPDESGRICDEYARIDSRVRVVHQPNRGLSEARNAGLRMMGGEFLLFVDGDDWIHESLVGILVAMALETGADICVCSMTLTASEDATADLSHAEIQELTPAAAIDHVIKRRYVSMVASCGKLYRADLFADVVFPPGRLHEDAFITHELILRANKVALTTAPLYFYRQRQDSITGAPFNPRAKFDTIDALTQRADSLRAAGMDGAAETTLGQALATFMSLAHYARTHPESVPAHAKLSDLARQLSRKPQPAKFTALYTLYLVSPALGTAVYRLLRGGQSR